MPEPTTLSARLRELRERYLTKPGVRFEADAEAFYAETHFIAPGKSEPPEMGGGEEHERRRDAAWERWTAHRQDVWTTALREAADALDACVAQSPRGTWQPIATAPKDGRAILLFPSACWCNEEDRGEVGYWDKFAAAWDRMGPVAVDYDGPTHWMPLPAAPVDEGTR